MRAVLSKMSRWRAGLGHPHSARRLASQLSNFSFHELTASISPDTDTAEVQRALATLCTVQGTLVVTHNKYEWHIFSRPAQDRTLKINSVISYLKKKMTQSHSVYRD